VGEQQVGVGSAEVVVPQLDKLQVEKLYDSVDALGGDPCKRCAKNLQIGIKRTKLCSGTTSLL
jgi:hypothetical protein